MSDQQTPLDPADANADAKALFDGTMPEKPSEVAAILAAIDFRRASDRPALHLEAAAFFGRGLVTFTDRTMQQIWLISYLSWQGLVEQSGLVIASLLSNLPYHEVSSNNSSLEQFAKEVDRCADALLKLRDGTDGAFPWPNDVPQLTPDLSQLRSKEDRAAYDLGCFAGSFVLLHKSCHALKRIAGLDYDGAAEEMACDSYAIDMLLDGSPEYARQNDVDPLAVVQKRAMGIFLGLIIIFEATERASWAITAGHPSIVSRATALYKRVDSLGLPPNDHFWTYATSVLLSKLRRENHLPTEDPALHQRQTTV